jgi:hypothetical protein
MTDWNNWSPAVPPSGPPTKNVSKDDWASRYARQHHFNQNPNGTYNPNTNPVLPCKPNLPQKMATNGLGANKDGSTDIVKVVDINSYIDNYLNIQSNLTAEETIAFNALTGNRILTFNKGFNVSENSETLNKNILDIVSVVNQLRPTELIKLQNIGTDYFAQFSMNLVKNTYSFNKNVGIATIYIPKSLVSENTRVQIETLTVGSVNNDTIY